MHAHTSPPKINLADFALYLLGAAMLAGFGIFENPTWPVVVGILALCALVTAVFCFVWSRGGLATSPAPEEPLAARAEDKN